MYRYSNSQISLSDFRQSAGTNLKENNRWVKKAQTIPWLDIEKRYARLFTNRKGNVAKLLRLALGICIIQAEYGYSGEETMLQIPVHICICNTSADIPAITTANRLLTCLSWCPSASV